MGQKFAAYNAQGQITAFYDDVDSPATSGATVLPITDTEWQQCLSESGWTVANGSLVAPIPPTAAQLLLIAQATQKSLLSDACKSAIEAGFSSSALGAAHTYGCNPTDQGNIDRAAVGGGSLWCADSTGAWTFAAHIQAQAAQVRTDMIAHIQQQQSHYSSLLAQIAAATTVSAVQAIVW